MALIFFSVVLIVTALLSWWISGYDPKLTGENDSEDIIRRVIRCGVTLILMAGGLAETMFNPNFAGFTAIAVAGPMVFLWINCLSEALADIFHKLIDNPSHSPDSDPKKVASDLDRLAMLATQGRTGEALRLCAELLKKDEGSRLAIETMCFRLYGQMFDDESIYLHRPLAEIRQLCEHSKFEEAESRLVRIVNGRRENLPAVFLLVRLYVQNLQQPDKAGALILSLEQKSKLPPMFAAYANERIRDWLTSSGEKSEEGIESLLAGRRVA